MLIHDSAIKSLDIFLSVVNYRCSKVSGIGIDLLFSLIANTNSIGHTFNLFNF